MRIAIQQEPKEDYKLLDAFLGRTDARGPPQTKIAIQQEPKKDDKLLYAFLGRTDARGSAHNPIAFD